MSQSGIRPTSQPARPPFSQSGPLTEHTTTHHTNEHTHSLLLQGAPDNPIGCKSPPLVLLHVSLLVHLPRLSFFQPLATCPLHIHPVPLSVIVAPEPSEPLSRRTSHKGACSHPLLPLSRSPPWTTTLHRIPFRVAPGISKQHS